MKRLLVVAITAAMISPASAQVTGNTWEANCASQELHDQVACHRYALGVADALQALEGLTGRYCAPLEARGAGQLVEVGRRYIRGRNPKDRDSPAVFLLIDAFKLAWPCKR